MDSNAIDFPSLVIGAVLNTSSGSCDATSEQKMLEILDAARISSPRIWCGGSEHMDAAFAEAKQQKLDVLIVLGGDGTIRAGAEMCTPEGPLLIALPGGTMNVLPKALYGNRSWEEALTHTLQHPKIRTISGGTAVGKQFFIAAILGAPARWAEAREALREGDIAGALDKGSIAFQGMFADKVKYSFSTQDSGETEAVSIICPLISDALPDTGRVFEAAAIDVHNVGEVLSLTSSAAFGKWRDDSHVSIVKTKRVSVSSEKPVPLILDGEVTEAGREVEIEFVPEAFKALVPAE